jgi:hypothetical protein
MIGPKGYDLVLTDWVGKASKASLFRFFSISSLQVWRTTLLIWGFYHLLWDKVEEDFFMGSSYWRERQEDDNFMTCLRKT